MDYPFENLEPESFQQFCQALLTKEFPNVQCFPVAQPDGGRDALSPLNEDDEHGFIMYQVKFVRQPLAEADPHKWLVDTLKGEAAKLKKQIPKGAKQYILLTNIKGTAHPDSGSIDKANQLLNSQLGVSSKCWWRDDLSRRLDNAWDLKWVYPALMTGQDLIRSVIESGLSENKERRASAIRAYVTHQFDIDQKVKFKQVELDNRLLDLFIDIPIVPPNSALTRKRLYLYNFTHRSIARDIFHRRRASQKGFSSEDLSSTFDTLLEVNGGRDEQLGAAAMLLHPLMQKHISCVVLEGAPGQGKSTITQYVCQVHRMQILGKEKIEQLIPDQYREYEAFEKLPGEHKFSSVRLPFRVDLRDLASWLAKQNPFSADKYNEPHPKWNKSLESFLAAQIENDSGGFEFDVADLHAVAKLSSILLVFDGLDEVADIETRREVVKEIITGVKRIGGNAASLQVIVTSRPAAFADSPGFPEDMFPYYHLGSVTRPLIDDYAKKWMKARKLDQQQIKDVKKVIQEKLDLPHLRDLARNAMQLTILFSLILRKTASLPDKRTALYDSYIELYFDREAEKNSVVRNNRELLIDINRYLAWILHVEAEEKNGSGRITQERLHNLLADYLTNEGYPESLVEDLLVCMVERVGALVSRVEGTYEFEVQPLREYFAAKHLYVTAPPSPPGNEKPGTKPDRFDAIARDFYWLNVTRFYAGCYSKGELADLIDRIEELITEDGYSLISYPRLLAAMLLSDWVFNQHPKSVRKVIELILDGIGLRYLLTSNSRRLGSGNPLVLPKDCGQDELITRCLAILGNAPPKDYALDVIDLIKANASSEDVDKLWLGAVLAQKNGDRTRWLEYGLYFGSISRLSVSELSTILSDEISNPLRIEILFKARRYDYFGITEEHFNVAFKSILSGDFNTDVQPRPKYILELLSYALDAKRYAIAFTVYYYPLSLSHIWQEERMIYSNTRIVRIPSLDRQTIKDPTNFPVLDKFYDFLNTVENESQNTVAEWATEITHWDNLVEKARSLFGEQWVFLHIANIASGIKSKSETCKGFTDLFDHSVSLCRRARYARLRAGTISYWQKLFEQTDNVIDKMFAVLLLITWGSQKTLEQLAITIDVLVENLSIDNWQRLYKSVEESVSVTQQSSARLIIFNVKSLPDNLKARTLTILSIRSNNPKDLYSKYLNEYNGTDLQVLQYWQSVAIQLLGNEQISWQSALNIISKSYLKGVVSERYAYQKFIRIVSTDSLPDDIAQKIAREPEHYPGFLVAAAEAKCRNIVASKVVKVGEIARKDNWF
ncbi:NTPase (NACHT family)-like protein [Nostoc sp. XA010]|uniref:NACHT domain-containing protein n=1 Tax=Nostoc sp. XA010 TaxID=2780407 RepID=UPI001E5EAEB9|nr:NTPase (NACHT family)-like protein [Nostoc sp. XA010]MCC5658763.1 NTPase (NACHT family)-like protein [Nostoc sp. XA010]